MKYREELYDGIKLVGYLSFIYPVTHSIEEMTILLIKYCARQMKTMFIEEAISSKEHGDEHSHEHSHEHFTINGNVLHLPILLIIGRIEPYYEDFVMGMHEILFPISAMCEPELGEKTWAGFIFEHFDAIHALTHVIELVGALKEVLIDNQPYTSNDLWHDFMDQFANIEQSYSINLLIETADSLIENYHNF